MTASRSSEAPSPVNTDGRCSDARSIPRAVMPRARKGGVRVIEVEERASVESSHRGCDAAPTLSHGPTGLKCRWFGRPAFVCSDPSNPDRTANPAGNSRHCRVAGVRLSALE